MGNRLIFSDNNSKRKNCHEKRARIYFYSNDILLNIEPHDTRVLHIRPALQRPQILATNRHISGAHSIEELKWNMDRRTLNGTSKTVTERPYSLFVHVPDNFSISDLESVTKIVSEEITKNMFKVTLEGQKEVIEWSLRFEQ